MTEEEFKKNAKTIPTNIETEEKIALDYFKYKVLPTTSGTSFESEEEHYTKVILSFIEKLQKENEELKKEKVTYLDKVYDKIDNFKYEYKKAERQHDPERASFYRDLIRHFKKLLEEE